MLVVVITQKTYCGDCGVELRDADHWSEHKRAHVLKEGWANDPRTMELLLWSLNLETVSE